MGPRRSPALSQHRDATLAGRFEAGREQTALLLFDDGQGTPRPTVFAAGGLPSYITEEENAALLDDLASPAESGRRLGMDILSLITWRTPQSPRLWNCSPPRAADTAAAGRKSFSRPRSGCEPDPALRPYQPSRSSRSLPSKR